MNLWSYSNNTLWQRVYEYLDNHNRPEHKLMAVDFASGEDYNSHDRVYGRCYPGITLIFQANGTERKQVFKKLFW